MEAPQPDAGRARRPTPYIGPYVGSCTGAYSGPGIGKGGRRHEARTADRPPAAGPVPAQFLT
ncbi:hypothetical protein SLA_1128 [Streptomyces laurentii]|uniref:Uncharacterized protein n=1 Tax=Streptomyces laurentii TaxID=39478 RepID=A0A160NWG3_STRLU|nr:hypothetical protein SLA_1128 [Streptomyces laurentii]